MPRSTEELRAYHRAWRAANHDKYLAHQNAYAKQWRKDNPERAKEKYRIDNRRRKDADPEAHRIRSRERNLRRQFGITPADYNKMFAAQEGRCAICQTDKPGGNGNHFHIDHSHTSNKIRGLLCAQCNTTIHAGRDTKEFFLAIIAYLERSP